MYRSLSALASRLLPAALAGLVLSACAGSTPEPTSASAPAAAASSKQAVATPHLTVVDANGNSLAATIEILKRYPNTLDSSDYHLLLRISAAGYYPSVQTFSRRELALPIAPVQLVARKPGRTLLVFAGDVMLGRRYYTPNAGEPAYVSAGSRAADSAALLSIIAPYFTATAADITSVNLETPIFTKDRYKPAPKSITFFAHPDLLTTLRNSGINYAALGNNHSYDYLDGGLRETLAHLDASGLAYSGAGLDAASALAPASMQAGATRVALSSMVGWPGRVVPSQVATKDKGGAAMASPTNIQQTLQAIDDATLSVFQFHGGTEYSHQPNAQDSARLRQAVRAGADLVIGHHPHVLQGFELYQGRLIAYSLGNFLFDQYIYDTQQSGLLYVWMDGARFHRAELAPLYIKGYRPTPATDAFRTLIKQRLVALSAGQGLEFSDSGGHLQLQAATQGAGAEANTTLSANLWPAGDFEQHGAFELPETQWQYQGRAGSQPLLQQDDNTALQLHGRVHQRYFMRTWYNGELTLSLDVLADKAREIEFCLELRDRQMSIDAARSNPERRCQRQALALNGQWTQARFSFTLPDNAAYRGYRFALAGGDSSDRLLVDNIRLHQANTDE